MNRTPPPLRSNKPVAGFPSTTAAIEFYWREGRTSAFIANTLKIDENVARAIMSRLRSRHRKKKTELPAELSSTAQIKVPRELLDKLLPAARLRHVSPQELARRILFIISNDDLIDGILDDKE